MSEYNLFELREYQKNQNNAIRESARKGNKRIISCTATGSGKSAMLADLTISALDKLKRVLIVLPRRSLVKQLSESFEQWGINHGVVMSGMKPFGMPRCQIASIDTYMSRLSNGRMQFIDADMVIIDEAHLQMSKKKVELFSRYKTVIGFTATPVAPRKQSMGALYQDIVSTISMQQLMDAGFLTPLRYFAKPGIDLSSLELDASGDYRESQLGDVMDKAELVGDILQNWMRIAEGKPTVVFASSQAHARHICDEFCRAGYKFEYVDCNTPDEDRSALFDRVRSGETIGIVNVGIVSVGIDIPNLAVVVLARPTPLISVYLQCVGRITRLYPGKLFGTVIDHAGIIERLGLATNDFEWSLDGSESVEERAKKKAEEKKEPKEIICKVCNNVFKSSRRCPKCGHEMVQKGEKIPCHECELEEVKVCKPKPIEKETFYAELLGYAKKHGKTDAYALAMFRNKFNEWPYNKKSIEPREPSGDVINYIKSRNIAYAKSKR